MSLGKDSPVPWPVESAKTGKIIALSQVGGPHHPYERRAACVPLSGTLVHRSFRRACPWGHYVVPLYHLAEDRVAYWDAFGRPALTPTYGAVIETWWTDPAKVAALGR